MVPTFPPRSVLFVPAANPRALEKSASLAADAVIFDLEDSVAPEVKGEVRERLRAHLASLPRAEADERALRIVRINPLAGPLADTTAGDIGTEDLLMARGAGIASRGGVDAILLPKVESAGDVRLAADALGETDAPESLKLWAMIETPRGILAATEIAASSPRLGALVVGPNDIVAATGIRLSPGRPQLLAWLVQIVLAAKAEGLPVIDGVYNDIGDAEGFAQECDAARAMGFSGKTLIHPSQIDPANLAFSPARHEIARARAIVDAFASPENAGKSVFRLDGRMVERMHLAEAERLIAFADAIRTRQTRTDP